jgi:hypothetical protein
MIWPSCAFCVRVAVAWHHLTGRSTPTGSYLDPSLVVPLCQHHHDSEHVLLRREGLDSPSFDDDLVGYRIARVLSYIGRCADSCQPIVFERATPYGDAAEGFHALLFEQVSARQATREEAAL